MNSRNLIFLVTTLVFLAADQATKWWVVENLPYPTPPSAEITIIPGFFSIVHAQNHGAAFSSFEGQLWLFYGFTTIAIGVIAWEFIRQAKDSKYMPFVLGLLLSGALGNFIDRLRQGYVTDMVKNYIEYPAGLRTWLIEQFGTNVWPIWNVADSALLIGVALFLIQYLFLEEDDPEAALEADTEAAAE